MAYNFEDEELKEEEDGFNSEYGVNDRTERPRPAPRVRQELSTDDAAEELVDRLEESHQASERVHRTSSEVQDRYHTAACYDTLIQQGRFFNEDTRYTAIVEAEVAAFCRRKMEILMGIRQGDAAAVIEPSVSREEILELTRVAVKEVLEGLFAKEGLMALQSLARVALKKSSIMSQSGTPAAPTVKTRAAQTPQAPVETLQEEEPIEEQVEVKRPTVKRPGVPTVRRPIGQPVQRQGQPADRPQGTVARPAPGKKFKKKLVEDIRTGKMVEVKLDVTGQVGQGKNPHGIPTLDGPALEQAMEMRAGRDLNAVLQKMPAKLQMGVAKKLMEE